MSRIRAIKYRIPFRQTFSTAAGSFQQREGLILHLDVDGISALGEVAPLPSFSRESLEECILLLKQHQTQIAQLIPETQEYVYYHELEAMNLPPSLEFGIDMLHHDYLSKSQSKPLRDFFKLTPSEQININAVSGLTDEEELMTKTEQFVQQGFKTIKLKVGINIEQEAALIANLRKQYPHLNIRLDANGAWTFSEAEKNLQVLEAFDIEFIEQPVLGIDHLAELRSLTKIPIAADEDFRNEKDLAEIVAQKGAEILIFKPMLIGHFRRISVTKARSAAHKIKAVFSSSLESGVGRKMSAILACFFGDPILAHGFSTDTLFKEDLFSQKTDHIHRFTLSDEYGIGIDFSQLSTSMMEGI